MKDLKNKIIIRLKSSGGESIGEVLVAVLIASVALIMLATMIMYSTNMIRNSRNKMKEYYQANESLASVANADDSADITVSDGTHNLTDDESITVYYSVNDKYTNTSVVAYKLSES